MGISEVTAYICSCNKLYRDKKTAKAHYKRCFFNPELQTCNTCNHSMGYKKDIFCMNPDFKRELHFKPAYTGAKELCLDCELWQPMEDD